MAVTIRVALAAAMVLGSAVQAAAAPAPSVLVTTETPRQGSVPRTLTVYGTIQAAPSGSQTLSLLRAGRVTRVLAAPGEAVKKGQPLLEITPDPSTVAIYDQAVAALNLARGQRARTAQMLRQRLATRDQLAQADKAVSDAQANLDALKRAGGGSGPQMLTSPFDGVVVALQAAPGAAAAPGAPLATVARSDQLIAATGLEPGRRPLVAPGQSAEIKPLDGGATIPGRVRSVGAMLDPLSRLVPMLVSIDPQGAPDQIPGLLAGEPVRVIVQTGALRGWFVPRDAVQSDAGGHYVFQLSGDKAVRVNVRVVGTAGGTTIVAGHVEPDRPLVTSGNYQLHDGGLVRQNQANAAGNARTATQAGPAGP